MRSKKALYNVLTSLLSQAIIIIYGFVVPKIIIGKFGSDVNGLISSITQFLSYITLLESGIGPVIKAALYKPIANKDKQNITNILRVSERFFRTIAVIFLVYIVVLSIIYPLIISKSFGHLYTISLLLIISISTFAEYFFGMVYRLYLKAEQKTYIITLSQSLTYIINIIVIIVLAKCGANIHIIKLISGIIFIIRPIFQNIYVKKKYNINLKDGDTTFELKQKWDGMAQHIASVVHNNTDITILTFFCSLTDVSVYAVYNLVVKGIKSLIQAFTGGIEALFGDMIAKNEKENLNKKFNLYEIVFFMLTTIIYTCTIILIVPFIKVYTFNITDTNYIRPIFAVLLVVSEFVWTIRLPYSSITLAAGHFKETKNGAWVEAIVNVVISLLLVNNFGIIGVVVGTLISMLIRTIEFIYHTNKYILERNNKESIKKIIIIIFQVVLIILICNYLPQINVSSYLTWIFSALITFIVATFVVLLTSAVIYKKQLKEIIKIIKKIFKKKNKKKL